MRGRRELRTGVSLAVLIILIGLRVTNARAAETFDRSDDILLKADRVIYDTENDVVTAEGHVEIDSKGRILLAKQVRYDQRTDTVTADGDVSLMSETGDVVFSNHAVLSNQMHDGVLDSFKALIGKSGRLVAGGANKHNDIVSATNGAYTPCKLCDGKPVPTWDVKADRIVFDKEKHRIYYRNATVEVFGIPVLYSPILSHADPSVKHQSGLLRPSGGTSSTLGTFVRLPYYIAISDSEDATIEPMITSQAGQLGLFEYRKRFDDGGMWLQPSVAYSETTGERYWHSSLFGYGRIPVTPTWRVGYDAALSSDQSYLKRYNISQEDTLDNDIFVEGLSGRSRFALSGYYFQDLREGRVEQKIIPIVLPNFEYSFIPRATTLGGQYRFDLSAASVTRGLGVESQRISSALRWRLPYVTEGGQLLSFTVDLKADAWRVAGDAADAAGISDLQGNPIAAGTRYITRGQPLFAADWRWPFISPGEAAGEAFVIEPIGQLIASPYGGNPRGIPNEDSSDFELDDTDIFSLDRLPGHALWESGPRLNAGIQAEAFFPKGSVEMLIGQVLRLKPDPVFAANTGLSGKNSDIVGRYRIRFLPYLSLTHRVDVDSSNGTVRRNEVYFDGTYGRSNLEVSYVRLSQQTIAIGDAREEIDGQMAIGIGENWTLFTAARRDIENNAWLDTEFGLGWENDCLGLSVAFQRRYTRFLDVPPSTSVLFNIIPKFGGDNATPARLFPSHIFTAPVQAAGVP